MYVGMYTNIYVYVYAYMHAHVCAYIPCVPHSSRWAGRPRLGSLACAAAALLLSSPAYAAADRRDRGSSASSSTATTRTTRTTTTTSGSTGGVGGSSVHRMMFCSIVLAIDVTRQALDHRHASSRLARARGWLRLLRSRRFRSRVPVRTLVQPGRKKSG